MSTANIDPPRRFLGQPMALAYLSFTEAWERFSYYGMTAILVLYMSQALLLPGHVEHIAGFTTFRSALESVFGPMTTLALASQIMGLYTGLVYFTPVLGGWVADRWIGRRLAVMLGAVMMSAGHLAMAFDASFLLALLLLIVGCGLLKGNISTQVGELYAETDGEGRTRAFAIFSIGINVGAVVGPLTCGLLAQLYGWHAGFGLAGVLMLIGLLTYIAGFRYLPRDRPRAIPTQAKAPLDRRQRRIVWALAVVSAITIFQSVSYYQNTNLALIWINRSVDLDLLGFHVPVAWFNSIDPLASIMGVPLLFALWRRQAARGREPDDLGKIGTGAWMAAAANLLLVAACLFGTRIPVIVPLLYDMILGISFLYYWPTLLALVSRAAPASIKATLMGAVFLSLFLANMIIGWLGGFYESMTPTAFWAMHAGIASLGGVLAFVLRRPLMRALAIDDPETRRMPNPDRPVMTPAILDASTD
ncbi:peptide MFS transporter [Rhodanobacter ginsengisoli]|uniref:Peptide MFS transporter n=1 Tax=Rhodanobacter ginsengisoli TaxID=418646 RepID=A0ABW0QMC6_9GAMM